MRLGNIVVLNYFGLGWATIMSLAFVPVYVELLGVEAFGIIGIYTLVQTWLALLDAGVRPMLSREMARWKSGVLDVSTARDLLRSAEILIAAIGSISFVAMFGLSGIVATKWLTTETLDPGAIHWALILMSGVVVLRLLESIYRSALIGLREQVWLSFATAILATLRYGGSVVILLTISETLYAFFIWQGTISLITLAAFSMRSWGALSGELSSGGRGRRPRFSTAALRNVKNFAAGMVLINLLVILSNQSDKIILSGLVSLEAFGYYALATTGASVLFILTTPITQAIYPTLVETMEAGDDARLRGAYRSARELLSALLAPLGIALIVFPELVLFAWSGQEDLSEATAQVLALLAGGYLSNALLQLPFYLQLASGRTRMLVLCFALSVACALPTFLWAIPRYGTAGAAAAWLAFQIVCLLTIAPIVHRKILGNEIQKCIFCGFLRPFLGPLLLLPLSLRFAPEENATQIQVLLFLTLFIGLGYATMLITCRPLRTAVGPWLARVQRSLAKP